MSSNNFRCRYTAEVAYDMLNEDSETSGPEEEVQEDIATVLTSVDEPPVQSVTDSDSSSDDDDDSSGNVIQPQLHTSTNGVFWALLHIARVKPATAANIFESKPVFILQFDAEQVLAPTSAGSYSSTTTHTKNINIRQTTHSTYTVTY